jgi:hypothetical protein
MAKRIELTSEKNFIGDSTYKSDDGLVYSISGDNQYVEVGCAVEARDTLVHADIANEVVIDGKLYPVTKTISQGFVNCMALEKVTFPPNMTYIGAYSFIVNRVYTESLPKLKQIFLDGCIHLKNNGDMHVERVEYDCMDTFLGMQTSIESDSVFVDGQEITDLVIPEGVTKVRAEMMKGCKNLQTVTLPSSIKYIQAGAFEGCENLEKVNLPDGLEIINSYAFRCCRSLKEVTLPATIEGIGHYAFSETAISEVNIPQGCKLYESVFEKCKRLKKVVLPDDLTEIPVDAFKGSAIETIELPATLQTICSRAFANCGLTQIVMPEGLQKIGYSAFSGTILKEITIPSTVTEIGEGVFDDCEELAHVYSKITNPAACDVKSFELAARSGGREVFYRQSTLHIPNVKGLLSAYKKKAAWKKFSVIVEDL